MAALTSIILFITLAIIAFILMEVITFIFWVNMLTDALKKRDTLWIVLLIASFLSGVLSGLFALLYYELMYKDNEGHHKHSTALIIMIVSTIVFFVVMLVLLIILMLDSGNIINSFSNSIPGLYNLI